MQSARTGRRERGFSLVEMVIVVVMIGILLTVALPFFRSKTDSTSVRGAADAISAMHGTAKLSSIQRGRITRLKMSAGSSTMWIVASKSSGTGLDTIGKVENLGTRFGVRFSTTRDSLVFTPRGIGTETSGTTIIVTKNGVADTLTISAAGRILH